MPRNHRLDLARVIRPCVVFFFFLLRGVNAMSQTLEPTCTNMSRIPCYQVLDGQLTWLVYMVGAVVGGHAATELHGSTEGVG